MQSGRDRVGRWRAIEREPSAAEDFLVTARAIGLLVAGWLVMAWPWISGRVTIPWDAKAHFQPQIQFLAQSIARGESPFWAPYVFSGHPQIADPQSMIFAPAYLLLALFTGNPSAWAVDMTTLCTALAGGIALLLWFIDRGWHWAGALVAGLVFVFGASMAWRMQHTGQVLSLAYWPMLLLTIDRAFDRRSILWALLAGFVGAAVLLGRDQVALLVLYVTAAYVIARWAGYAGPRVSLKDTWWLAIAGGIIAVAIAAVPLVLTAQLAGESNRPAIDFVGAGRGSLHPALLLTWFVPQVFGAAGRMEDYWGPPSFAWNDTGLFIAQNMGQVYIGALPAVLLLAGFRRGWFWSREIAFFAIAFVLVTLYALGWYTPAFRVFYEVLPGVSLYRRPADATFLLGGIGAVLAGYAVHRLFVEPWLPLARSELWFTAAVASAAIAACIGLGIAIDRVGLLANPLVAAGLSFGLASAALAVAMPRRALEPAIAAVVIGGALVADLGWNNGPSTSSAMPPSMYEVLEPQSKNEVIAFLKSHQVRNDTRRDRIELLGLGFHWPNASLTHRLENTLGYNPVRLSLYSRAVGAEDHVGLAEQRKLSKLFPSYSSVLANMLGLRFVAAGAPLEKVDPSIDMSVWKLVATIADTRIYENGRTLPRVLLAENAMAVDFERILSSGQWPQFDPKQTVLLESLPPGLMVPTNASAATARIVSYGNTEVVIETKSDRGGVLVVNDLWHPSWMADVDGREVEVLRANVLFRGVQVPAGVHRVRFSFRPVLGMLRRASVCCQRPAAR